MQEGQLIAASGSIYIRFYRGGKRVAERLCKIDDVHYGVKAKAVKLLRDQFMLKVNAPSAPTSQLTVSEFWTAHYLPWAESVLKPSSVHGYKKLWEGTLKKHFDGRTLADYKTHHGSEFLTSLCPRMGRNSIGHVRSLCSGIFSVAVNKGLIERNVWGEVKVLARPKQTKPTGWYTLDEAAAIIKELQGRERAAFGLCFYMGLRPGELCGLRWEDFSNGSAYIKRSVWRKHVGTTKTGSEQKVPVIAPARELLDEWRSSSGNPSEGWLFEGPSGRPLAAQALIRPMKAKLNGRWKGLYSARRGMSTAMTELTGSPLASKGLLRHRSLSSTVNHYVRETPEETKRGMAMVERELAKKAGQPS